MSDEANAIGKQLRDARERMGLGVAQAAEQLHVDEKVIDAMETGRFQALGATVYAQGHLRHYAELVNEPSVSDRYASLQQAPPDLTNGPTLPVHPAAPRRRWPLIVFALILALAVAAWWAMGVKTS